MVQQAGEPVAAALADVPAIRIGDGEALDPIVQPQCSLAVQLRRASGAIVGRAAELEAIGQQIHEARTRLCAVTIEGEPGIGKTRLLVAAADQAAEAGFCVVAVTADEEIRGPFLVARSIFANPAIVEAAAGTPAAPIVARTIDALSGRDEPGLEHLAPDAKVLRTFDLAGVAISTLALVRPVALLIDDLQWADDDTLRLLRYVVRSVADRPVFLFVAIRPEEFAGVPEAVNFVADMERMGLVRRLRLDRFSQVESSELLRQVLGGAVDAPSAAAMHAQSEGVPFIVEELARTHREAGTLQQANGEWRLGRNAARLMPAAVRTLITRRAARLPAATRAALADAAILGRSFSLRDLRAVRARVDDAAADDAASPDLAADLMPAVEAGLLLPQRPGVAADYTFTHEQVRDFATAQLTLVRKRQVHGAVVALVLEAGTPSPDALPMLASHALAAGDLARAARFSIDAAAGALRSNAPEEALRLVEAALPVVSDAADRRTLLTTRDDAYAAARRAEDRLQGLAELGALAEALRDRGLELDVQLRRAAALRATHDEDAAADLARRVRDRAAEAGDAATELRANLELGQALLHVSLGESFGVSAVEVDLDGGEAAYRRAAELARQLGDERSLADALREIGTLLLTRTRQWFAGIVQAGQTLELEQRVAAGEPIESILASTEIAPVVGETRRTLQEALAIYERLGDRTGVMSTVIAIAYSSYAPAVHIQSSARHLEEIRRITNRQSELVTESERARQELHLLYGVHVYARAKVVPDLAIARGIEAHRAARLLGDRAREFSAAGGVALAHLELGDIAEAERWLETAAGVLAAAPSPARSRSLELWRGIVRARAGDEDGMRRHLEGAAAAAAGPGRAVARIEALARLGLEAARLGARRGDDALLTVAADAANEVLRLAPGLPGHAPWGPQGHAALATVALARGDVEGAVGAGSAALRALQEAHHEDANLDIVLPAARALMAGAPPEAQAGVREWLRLQLSRIARATLDDQVRVRWLQGPVGREMVELSGALEPEVVARSIEGTVLDAPGIDEIDRRLLHLLTEGRTNEEIGAELGLGAVEITQRLAALLARIGVSSRAEATSLAFRAFAR